MNTIKRYGFPDCECDATDEFYMEDKGMCELLDGGFVKWEDYASLQAEVLTESQRWKQISDRWIPENSMLEENARLKAEVERLNVLLEQKRKEWTLGFIEYERLRKAGDAMLGDYIETGVIFPPSQDAWLAAKREQGCIVDSNKVAQYLPKQNAAKEGKQS